MSDRLPNGIARYFLGIVPPDMVGAEIQKFREYFRDVYGCRAALRSPPHITLHMPFLYKEQKEDRLIEKLHLFVRGSAHIGIELNGFGAFIPRVIYLNVNFSEPLLLFQKKLERFCKRELQLFNANRLNQPYHPHLTIAFRDLKRDKFLQAWAEFCEKKYETKFTAHALVLLKHNGKEWRKYKDLVLAE